MRYKRAKDKCKGKGSVVSLFKTTSLISISPNICICKSHTLRIGQMRDICIHNSLPSAVRKYLDLPEKTK